MSRSTRLKRGGEQKRLNSIHPGQFFFFIYPSVCGKWLSWSWYIIYVSMMHYGLKAPWRAVAIYNWPPDTGSISTCNNLVFNKQLDWSLHCTLARLTAHPVHSTALHLLTPFTFSLTTLWEHWNLCVHTENAFSRNNRNWRCHWKHPPFNSPGFMYVSLFSSF